MPHKPVLLIVDDDLNLHSSLTRVLEAEFDVRSATSSRDVEGSIGAKPDVVLLDLCLTDDAANRDGLEVLRTLRQRLPHTPILMLTGRGDVDAAVECMRLGAADFLQKPRATVHDIRTRLATALERVQQQPGARDVDSGDAPAIEEPRRIIGASPAIVEVKRQIRAVADDGEVPVLIVGETGTGKELVARAIHASGPRKDAPFVPLMVSALQRSVMESELFGHEAGAFTDARQRRMGYLEKSQKGVLFLDEVGESNPDVQLLFLRFLEEREFSRVGSTMPIAVDVQVVSATSADLTVLIDEKRFRPDLYYRLKGYEIRLPALRERAADIPQLVDYFLSQASLGDQRPKTVTSEVAATFRAYRWPGNVRQLRHVVLAGARSAAAAGRNRIGLRDLPQDFAEAVTRTGRPIPRHLSGRA